MGAGEGLKSENSFQLLEISEYGIGCLVASIGCPADAFQPNGLTADLGGGHDVFVLRVANYDNLFRLHT